jgi:hypothetical protein
MSAPTAPCTRASPWLPTAVVFLVVPPLVLWPMPVVGLKALLTMPQGEGAGHLWALGAALHERSPLSFHTDLLCYPAGVDSLLIDPANLPFFALGLPLGPAAAYNAILLGGLLLMGLAGALLARRVNGAPWLGALAAMACPAFLAGTIRGATEQLAVGWVGLGLALLLWALERGGAWRIALAAVAMGTCAWAGPYNGVWIAGLGLAVGLATLVRSPRLALTRALPAGLGAGLVAAPVAWAILTRFSVMNDPRFANPGVQQILARFRYPRGGNIGFADLLDPWVPAPITGAFSELSQTTYLGLALIVAAGVALAWNRRLWPWALGALLAAAVGLGPWIYLNGALLSVGDRALAGPALFLSRLPFLGSMTHWYRVAPVAGLLLAAMVSTLGYRRWSPLLAAVILADALLLSPFAWPHQAWAPPDPAAALTMQGPGAVLEIPATTQGDPPPGSWRNVGGLHQLAHGRPISSTVMLLSSDTAPILDVGRQQALATGTLLAEDRQALLEAGFRWLAVYPAYRPRRAGPLDPEPLEACLGPALHHSESLWIFDLALRAQRDCPGPETPR